MHTKKHRCVRHTRYGNTTSKSDDSLLYTANYRFFQKVGEDEDYFFCQRVKTSVYNPYNLDFYRVGVSQWNGLETDTVKVRKTDVLGKAVKALCHLTAKAWTISAIPREVLNEGH